MAESDIIFIGVLPSTAREILPGLPFTSKGDKLVISMMATVDLEEVLRLTGLPAVAVVRTVPLPSCARRDGPILVFPAYPRFVDLLGLLGTPVGCNTEAEMKPLVALTGHISSFFELMNETEKFMTGEGVSSAAARRYVSSFYSSLARSTELSTDSFAELAEEAATPGGINEQSINFLKNNTQHFVAQSESLSAILDRLRG